MIYGHGDDIYQINGEIKANFSSNVWMKGPSPQLLDAIRQMADVVSHYPEPNAQPLREALAEHHRLRPENFIVHNGTTESIYQLGQCFQDTSATILIPTFAEYEDAAKINRIRCHFLAWEDLPEESLFSTDLVFICNPNNPTGHQLALATLEHWLRNHPQVIFIIDEAYYAFARHPRSAIHWVNTHQNLIILRSLTKRFAVPGLRLGYVAASSPLIDQLEIYKIPWSVNAFALRTGCYIMHHHKDLLPPMSALLEETMWLRQQIDDLAGYQCQSSHTSFFLVHTSRGKAVDLKDYLIREHQLLIRNADNFRGLDSHTFRLATQTHSHNVLLLNALAQWNI